MGSEDWGQSSPSFPGFDLSLEQIIEKTARWVSWRRWKFCQFRIEIREFSSKIIKKWYFWANSNWYEKVILARNCQFSKVTVKSGLTFFRSDNRTWNFWSGSVKIGTESEIIIFLRLGKFLTERAQAKIEYTKKLREIRWVPVSDWLQLFKSLLIGRCWIRDSDWLILVWNISRNIIKLFQKTKQEEKNIQVMQLLSGLSRDPFIFQRCSRFNTKGREFESQLSQTFFLFKQVEPGIFLI